MHIFQTIEDAVISTLAPLAEQGVRTIEAYAGELDISVVEDLSTLPRRMPAIFVSADQLVTEVRNRVDIGTVDLSVAVCTRHLRGARSAARGDAKGEPGLFELMERTEGLLNGERIVPGWSAFRWLGVQKWIRNPNHSLCIYLERFQTTTPLKR